MRPRIWISGIGKKEKNKLDKLHDEITKRQNQMQMLGCSRLFWLICEEILKFKLKKIVKTLYRPDMLCKHSALNKAIGLTNSNEECPSK